MTTPKPEPASVMTPNEARECLDRYNTSHWNKDGRRARYSIPASPMDDDIRMAAFIDQAEADRARIRELEGAASANAHELAVGEALREAVFGRPVSDFMESFEIVRMAQDLHGTISLANSELATAREQIRARDEEIARLREVLKALADKLDAIGVNPSFLGVAAIAHLHGMTYDGPSWSDELISARAALKPEPASR